MTRMSRVIVKLSAVLRYNLDDPPIATAKNDRLKNKRFKFWPSAGSDSADRQTSTEQRIPTEQRTPTTTIVVRSYYINTRTEINLDHTPIDMLGNETTTSGTVERD